MIGIRDIGYYIPHGRISNLDNAAALESDPEFIRHKIGIEEVARKSKDEDTSDLAVRAIEDLVNKSGLALDEIEVLILITQNPDTPIPHASAVVHGKMGLSQRCAVFDISLGCSGYVYGLSVITAFMNANELKRGLLVTSDPYSKIIDPTDRSTVPLFGDAATATLIAEDPVYQSGKFTFGTNGAERDNLVCREKLFMNGRGIYNFAAKKVPEDVRQLLELNGLELADVDRFVFHQGSKYILDALGRRLGIAEDKVANDIVDYGNTVSSSIPIILARELNNEHFKTVLICGFGVGLSWSSNILFRT